MKTPLWLYFIGPLLVMLLTAGCAAATSPSASPETTLPDQVSDLAYRAFLFDPVDRNTMFASRSIGLVRSTDGGETWNPVSLRNTDLLTSLCAAKIEPQIGQVPNIVVLDRLSEVRYLVSINELGSVVLDIESCQQGSQLPSLVLSSAKTSTNGVFAGTTSGQVMHFSDTGETLDEQYVFPGGRSVVSMAAGPESMVYALSDDGEVSVRDTNTITWTRNLSWQPPLADGNALAYNKGTGKWFYNSKNIVYRYADGLWTQAASFPEDVINITVSPSSPRVMFVVTQNTIWRSADFGSSWIQVHTVVSAERSPANSPTSTKPPTPTSSPTVAPSLTPTSTRTATSTPTANPTPHPSSTPTEPAPPTPPPTPTATPSPTTYSPTTPSPTPTNSPATATPTVTGFLVRKGYYCVFLDQKLPLTIGDNVRLLVAVSATDIPDVPSGYEEKLDCDDIDIYPEMRLRAFGIPVENEDELLQFKQTLGLDSFDWPVLLKLDNNRPTRFQLMVSHSQQGSWQDLTIARSPAENVRQTLWSQYDRELIGAIGTVIGALIGAIVAIIIAGRQNR